VAPAPLLQKVKERLSHWLVARADVLLSRLEIMRRAGDRAAGRTPETEE